MLDVALQFLTDQLNSHLHAVSGVSAAEVRMGKVVDEGGKYAIPQDSVGAALINIEEERVLKSHLPEYGVVNGQHAVLEPDLKLNLQILFAANFKLYDVALKYISLILTYFQSHQSFTPSEYPALDQRITKLALELQSLSFEQLNQIWAFIGGKQLPSVVYRVRMVMLQDRTPKIIQPPIAGLERKYQGKAA